MTTLLLTAPRIAYVPMRPAQPARRAKQRLPDPGLEEGKLGLYDLLVSAGQVGAALGFCLMVHGLS